MRAFFSIIIRDVKLAWRQGNSTALALAFFLIAVTLFPLGVGPEMQVLTRISAGVLWVALMLSALLSLDRLFHADFEDGSLDHIALSPLPLEMVVFAKVVAHWVTTILPLLVVSPLLAVGLNMDTVGLPMVIISMAVGSPALSLFGAIGASLTVAMKRGGVLVSLLVLPLYIPTLIFGVSAIDSVINNVVSGPSLLILGAISLFSAVLAPFAAAGALRLSLE